ncbi:MAG: universal stress protein [Thermodesulfobacteriota bacterium]
MYKRILVPLDGSALAECALSHVETLVKDGAAKEVTLLNVVAVHIPLYGDLHPGPLHIGEMRESLFKQAGEYLAEVKARLASRGIAAKTEMLEGNRPADAIADYAREKGVDLIVIATHGYTGLKKLMLGSVALGVLHESQIPVLLIRPESCRM